MALSSPVVDATASNVVAAGLMGRRRDWRGTLFQLALLGCLGVSLGILGVLLIDVIGDASGVLGSRGTDFLAYPMSSNPARVGVAQGLWGTMWIAVFVVVVAFPVGIGAAVYLEEYAPRNRMTSFVELNIRNLAGVPSVVYGLLGLAVFVRALKGVTGGSSVISAGLTLAVLVIPLIVITSAEAIRSVPQPLREGAYGVGATKWEVVRTQVLPYAAPGILTGTLLSLSRAVGEAAPLLLIGAATGFLTKTPAPWDLSALRGGFTAMPSLITSWVGRPQEEFHQASAAAIIVLLVFVLLLNSIAVILRHRFEKRR
jgi:phosphate transport system permease protein